MSTVKTINGVEYVVCRIEPHRSIFTFDNLEELIAFRDEVTTPGEDKPLFFMTVDNISLDKLMTREEGNQFRSGFGPIKSENGDVTNLRDCSNGVEQLVPVCNSCGKSVVFGCRCMTEDDVEPNERQRPIRPRSPSPYRSSPTSSRSPSPVKPAAAPAPKRVRDEDDDEVDQPKTKKARTSWTIEEQAAIYNFVVEQRVNEGDRSKWTRDVAFWVLISNKMNKAGFARNLGACKNYWNRYGRAKTGYDERVNPTAQLKTSTQTKKSKKN